VNRIEKWFARVMRIWALIIVSATSARESAHYLVCDFKRFSFNGLDGAVLKRLHRGQTSGRNDDQGPHHNQYSLPS
jgi:hypothetical protein